ncbi:MAG: hypothetical protein SVM80_02465 [Halobacteriota archaeon]|nr:hypothetical protein [Halobacteriota archaeon]
MYAQELMKTILEGLTIIFNGIPELINTFGRLDYPATKAGNVIGAIVSAGVNLLGPFSQSNLNLTPVEMKLYDRMVYLTMNNETVNSAYRSINLSVNEAKIIGPEDGISGLRYLMNATANIGVDGANGYIGDPTISVEFLASFYNMLGSVLGMLGELMQEDLMIMFPWG